jgi:chemotaxis-related protein WspB
MLLTILQVGDARYAIEATHIVEVLPLLRIAELSGAPRNIAGVCNYRGVPTMVLDLNLLAGHPPTPPILSTRLLLLAHADTRFALRAAAVVGTLKVDADALIPSPAEHRDAPWLGPLIPQGSSFIQRLEVEPLAQQIGALS